MGDGVVQLASKSHHENILGSLHQLRLQGKLSDVTVQVDYQGEVEEFQAHQVMLAASSGYFKRILLSQHAAPDKLLLSNMHTADFSNFLEFVYTGKVEVARDKVGDVREAALLLECKDLSEVCGEAMSAGDSEKPTKPSLQDAETAPRTGGKKQPKRAFLKRQGSTKSSEREGACSKRLKATESAKGEEEGSRRLSTRLAGRKVPGKGLNRTREDSSNKDMDNVNQHTNEKTEENKAKPKTQTQRLTEEGKECIFEIQVSDLEDEEEDEDVSQDDAEDPLFLSLGEEREEGESQKTSKRASKAQFQCEKCQRTFHYEKSYLKHISTYHGVKAEVTYRCETCQQTFANRGNLKIHEKHVHSDERLFACQVCTKTFKRKKDVVRHQRQVHERSRLRHVCPDCGKTLSSKTALLLHERTHTGTKPFECTDCGARFTQSSALKMHRRTHTGEKPFACDQCNARFTQKHMLSYHKRSHTGEKPFMCEACGKSFASKEYLRHHSNIHTGSKPYKCKQCGRGFAQRNSLHQHLKIHTGERPYGCKDCLKQFTQLNALQRHQRIHTGEKPYMCGLCNRTFTDKSTVRRHTMTHDTDAPWKNYLVVLEGNVEGKKPKTSPKGKAEGAGEKQSKAGDGGGGGIAQAEAIMVPAETASLSADWGSQGTIALVSHSALGGITVIHTEVPPGTQIQPIVTTDSTGASVISLDGSAISVPFTLPVSMAHPIPVSSAASSSSLSVPVSLTVPVSEATLASVSETPMMSTASVLEAAVSQTILTTVSEMEAAPETETDSLDPDIQTVIVLGTDCNTEETAAVPSDG